MFRFIIPTILVVFAFTTHPTAAQDLASVYAEIKHQWQDTETMEARYSMGRTSGTLTIDRRSDRAVMRHDRSGRIVIQGSTRQMFVIDRITETYPLGSLVGLFTGNLPSGTTFGSDDGLYWILAEDPNGRGSGKIFFERGESGRFNMVRWEMKRSNNQPQITRFAGHRYNVPVQSEYFEVPRR